MPYQGGTLKGKDKLAYMANQIAVFFGGAMPHDAAVAGTADHLNKFWEPRMRRQFFEIVDAGGTGLSPLAIAAAAQVRKPGPVNRSR
jgi:formate dehydrogenase subunit delta